MRRLSLLPLAAVALLAIAADRPTGYLAPGVVDLLSVLPAAPVKGDVRYEADRKIFRALTKQAGTPRWDLATRDVPTGIADVMTDFSCAAGITLSPEATPATFKLLANASTDTSRENNVAKDHFKRQRPFLIDKGRICDPSKDIAASYDYPSGHTTRGWTFGLILSELLPDRITPIMVRARSYGESRLVCGVHNMSAVEAGRTGATVTMAFVRATPAYQADLIAAREELAKARSTPGPTAASCAADQTLVAPSVLSGLKP